MKKIDILIQNRAGLHIRPATKIVQLTHQYPRCKVEIVHNGEKADAKSIMSILTLAIDYGSMIKIITNGKDEERVLQELVILFHSGFTDNI